MKKFAGIVLGLLLLGAAAAAGWFFLPKPSSSQSVSGTIQVDEVRLASRYGGRVAKTHAREGAPLAAGQLVLELDAPELKPRREQIAALLAEQKAGARKEEIAAARQEAEAVAAELVLARQDLKRADGLFADKVISASERDRLSSRVEVLEKNAAAANSRLDLLLAGTRPERIAQTEAQLAEIDTQLAELRLTAPEASVLEVLNVKVGDVLAASREAATLLLTNHLWVRVFVPEPWLGKLQTGQPVKVKVDTDSQREFDGVVEQIQRSAEFTPRNVQTTEERIKQVFGVKVRLDPSQGVLRAGMSADVYFPNMPVISGQ